jgi:hypothetical protein
MAFALAGVRFGSLADKTLMGQNFRGPRQHVPSGKWHWDQYAPKTSFACNDSKNFLVRVDAAVVRRVMAIFSPDYRLAPCATQ